MDGMTLFFVIAGALSVSVQFMHHGNPSRHAILAAHPRLQRGGGLDDARPGEEAGGEKAEAQAVH